MITLEYLKGKIAATMLIVSDDRHERRLIAGYLRDRGFEAHEASTMAEGRRFIEERRPDIVICDQMPDASPNYSFFRHFRYPGSTKDYYIILPDRGARTKEDVDRQGEVFHRLVVSEEIIMRAGVELQLEKARNKLVDRNRKLREGLRIIEERQRQADHELEEAKRVQKALLPKVLPRRKEYAFSYLYEPSLGAGGDYIDFLELGPDKVAVILADVSGHGVSAAMMTGLLHGWIHSNLSQETDLAVFVEQLNVYIQSYSLAERYITMFMGLLDTTEHSLRYVLAGHPDPVFCSGSECRFLEEADTPAIGIYPEIMVKVREVRFGLGDTFFVYSDGLVDAFFSQEQDPSVFTGTALRQLDSIVRGDLHEFARTLNRSMPNGSPPDDMAMLVVGRNASRDGVVVQKSSEYAAEAMAGLLMANDYSVRVRSSCAGAADALRSSSAGVFIAGVDALNDPDFVQARTARPDVLLGLVCAREAEGDAMLALTRGCHYYLEGPVSDQDVLFMVNELRRFDPNASKVVLRSAEKSLYEFELPSCVDALISLQSFMTPLLKPCVPEDTLWEIHFIVNELCRNAIEWGNGGDCGRSVLVSLAINDECVAVSIEDEGHGYSLEEALGDSSGRQSSDEDEGPGKRAGGFGLVLATEIASCFQLNDRGNRVTVSFSRAASSR